MHLKWFKYPVSLSAGLLFLIGGLYSYHYLSKKYSDPMKTMSPALLQEITKELTKHFAAEIQIQSMVQLSEAERRNLVLRIMLTNPTNVIPASIIFKQSLKEKTDKDDKEAFARFARDWAGLEFLNSLKTETPLAPRFYGGNATHRFVLLEDLGEKHISLVNSLTGKDQATAQAALKRFMLCLGKFHASGYGHVGDYQKILTDINPQAESWQDELNIVFDDIMPNIESVLQKLKMLCTQDIKQEVESVLKAVFEPGPFTTLIHGDICPDNTFDDPKKNKLYLIDFEHAGVRNALWDGTYLRMNMPTCWCYKAIPNNIIDCLEIIYRQELMKTIPAAQNDNIYYKAYTSVCAFWMLKIFDNINNHVDKIDEDYTNSGFSRVLSRLQAFIDVAEQYDKLPFLKNMAKQVLQELKIRWPKVKPLDVFPAFIQCRK